MDVRGLIDHINILPNKDLTIIGDQDINLSGGQKIRLNLARCVYKNADIYLFDDPLSSIDTSIANHIFLNIFNIIIKTAF